MISGGNQSRLIVILSSVAATIAVIATVLADKPDKNRLEAAADLISGKMLLTRQKAMASNSRYRMTYDFDSRSFHIYREVAQGRWELDPAENRFMLPRGVSLSKTSIPESASISINPDGTIDASENMVWLRLSDGKSTQRSVRITQAGVVQELATW